MELDDSMDLVFITPQNFLRATNLTRKEASDILRSWYHTRDWKWRMGWRRFLPWHWKKTYTYSKWLRYGTFAINYELKPEGGSSFANWSIGWEYVLGMYLATPAAPTNQETLEVQKRMAAAIEEQNRILKEQANQGDDWKEETE